MIQDDSDEPSTDSSSSSAPRKKRIIMALLAFPFIMKTRSRSIKRLQDPTRGLQDVDDVLNSPHPERCLDRFRMSADGFLTLESLLRTNPNLKETHRMPLRLQLAVYLDWVSHGTTYRRQLEIFQVGNSQLTFSRYNITQMVVESKFFNAITHQHSTFS